MSKTFSPLNTSLPFCFSFIKHLWSLIQNLKKKKNLNALVNMTKWGEKKNYVPYISDKEVGERDIFFDFFIFIAGLSFFSFASRETDSRDIEEKIEVMCFLGNT